MIWTRGDENLDLDPQQPFFLPEKFGGKKQANSFLLDKYLSVESYKNGHIPSLYSLLRPVHLPLITWYLIKSSAPI